MIASTTSPIEADDDLDAGRRCGQHAPLPRRGQRLGRERLRRLRRRARARRRQRRARRARRRPRRRRRRRVFAAEVAARRGRARRTAHAARAARRRAADRRRGRTAPRPGVDRADRRSAPSHRRATTSPPASSPASCSRSSALICFALGRGADRGARHRDRRASPRSSSTRRFRRAGFHPATLIGLLGCVAIVGIAYNHGERAFPLVTALVVVFTLLWYLFEVVHARPMVNVAVTLLGFVVRRRARRRSPACCSSSPDGVGLILGARALRGRLRRRRLLRRLAASAAAALAPRRARRTRPSRACSAGWSPSIVLGVIVAAILGSRRGTIAQRRPRCSASWSRSSPRSATSASR